MPREIKFCGWHVTQKRMFSAEEMAADQLTLLPTGQFINVHGGSTRLSQIYPLDKFIPLQFTGLHDKNGKEIYENFIIKVWGTIYVVQWQSEGSIGWCLEEDPGNKYTRRGMNSAYEIIGNIYENSDLLTEVKKK